MRLDIDWSDWSPAPAAVPARYPEPPAPHYLTIDEISDEGVVEFRAICPAGPGETCPLYDPGPGYGGCAVQFELGQIGPEIIRGIAYGPGPWRCTVTWENVGGYYDGAEAYIDLIDDPPPARPFDNQVLSV